MDEGEARQRAQELSQARDFDAATPWVNRSVRGLEMDDGENAPPITTAPETRASGGFCASAQTVTLAVRRREGIPPAKPDLATHSLQTTRSRPDARSRTPSAAPVEAAGAPTRAEHASASERGAGGDPNATREWRAVSSAHGMTLTAGRSSRPSCAGAARRTHLRRRARRRTRTAPSFRRPRRCCRSWRFRPRSRRREAGRGARPP